MIIETADILSIAVPIISSWAVTAITIIWKFDKRITKNETIIEAGRQRIEKCETNIEKHETRIGNLEVKTTYG